MFIKLCKLKTRMMQKKQQQSFLLYNKRNVLGILTFNHRKFRKNIFGIQIQETKN